MSYNQTTKNELQIMHWNAQGITTPSAIIQLERFLFEKQIDIFLINETFLNPGHKFKVNNYKIYREDRPSHGGGVLIGVRRDIPHQRLEKFPTITIENISIIINLNNHPVRITSAYSPRFTNHFVNDLEIITTSASEFFIFGDFNAHHISWHCLKNNTAGNKLYNHHLISNYLIYYPNSYTRYGQQTVSTTPSVVDLMLMNSTLQVSPIATHEGALDSDHIPLTCTIFGSFYEKSTSIPLYNKANWKNIGKWVETEINRNVLQTGIITHNNIEDVINKTTSIVQNAVRQIPIGKKQTWQRKLSKLTLNLIGQRNRYRRLLQRCSDHQERLTITAVLKQLRALIDYHVCHDRNNSWSTFLQGLPPGNKKFWLLTKAIKGKKTPIGPLSIDGVAVYNNEQIANEIANVFEYYHGITQNMSSSSDRVVLKHMNWLQNQVVDDAEIEFTCKEEVQYLIKKLKNGKAPGIDGIKPIILKNMPDSLLTLIVKIFNWCLKNTYFPKSFKHAKVIPILKQGKDPKSAKSYRPISMLNCLDKVFEKIILSRLSEQAENNNVLKDEQFGFRSEHSTTHQIKRIVNTIKNNKMRRKSTGIVFLDIEKAFDTIWHNGLVFKLNKFGFPIYLQKIIMSFLSERSFVVDIGNHLSDKKTILAGVPQGSVLSPLLYSIYTSDYTLLKRHSAALYADDTAILSSGKVSNAIVKNMKASLVHVEKYFSKWKIKINEGKTQAIIFPFNKSPKRIPTINLTIQGSNVPLQNSIKYLGVILDKKLTFKEHISYISRKALRCGRALFPLLNRKSSLNVQNKILLYKMCIRPIMTYGCQVWSKLCAKTHFKKLQIIQNKNLKIIFNKNRRYSTRRLHIKFKQDTFENVVSNLTKRFEDRNRSSTYLTLRNLNN